MSTSGGSRAVLVGLISDTHGLLRPEALRALEGCGLIIHAGDVGGADILDRLREIAPVHAVRGNVDGGPLRDLPRTEAVEVAGAALYVIHIVEELDVDPRAGGFDAVIHGHTHRSRVEEEGGVLWLNPGSAGPRRSGSPVTVARLRIEEGRIEVELVELPVGGEG